MDAGWDPFSRQEWRTSLDAYVRHFTSSLELEYEAERQAVLEKVQKRSTRQLQVRFGYVLMLGSRWQAISFRFEMGKVRYFSMLTFMPCMHWVYDDTPVTIGAYRPG